MDVLVIVILIGLIPAAGANNFIGAYFRKQVMKNMTDAGRKFITGTAAVLFIGTTLALSAPPVEAQEVPGCRTAWNNLYRRDALREARALIGMDCPVMYREGWLVNPSKLRADVIPSCVHAWNALARKGALTPVQFLVTHNCPVIRRQGWR